METVKKVARVAVPLALMALPLVSLALTSPTAPITGTGITLQEVQDRIDQIANFLIVVSIIIAVAFIVWGAIVWMSAGGNEDRVKSGKAFVVNGIIGAAVVFAIGVILSTLQGVIARTFFGGGTQ